MCLLVYWVYIFLELCYRYLGLLTIDGELIGKDSKTGLTSVNDINVLYVGGFPKDAKQIGVVPVCILSNNPMLKFTLSILDNVRNLLRF